MAIKYGDKVKIHYKGTLDDGTVFDSSEGRDPLEFEVGSKQVIPGFEKAVKGMKKGDKNTFKIDCKDAYGEQNPSMVQKIPRDKLPADQEPKAGMMVGIGLPNGQQMPAKITKVTDKEVTLDVNHPLAGKNLTFEIELVSVNQ
jgi:FKBP-type peptidyl-prolyl cis-trans isomerase 2